MLGYTSLGHVPMHAWAVTRHALRPRNWVCYRHDLDLLQDSWVRWVSSGPNQCTKSSTSLYLSQLKSLAEDEKPRDLRSPPAISTSHHRPFDGIVRSFPSLLSLSGFRSFPLPHPLSPCSDSRGKIVRFVASMDQYALNHLIQFSSETMQ